MENMNSTGIASKESVLIIGSANKGGRAGNRQQGFAAGSEARSIWLIRFLLLVIVALAFSPVLQNGFVNYDDPAYVYGNGFVQRGWSLDGTRWAFTTFFNGFWHPLTWLSIMTDSQLFGPRAGWHHFTSLLLHAANTLLLFQVLRQMTGAVWRSALAAALFGVHPLHIESVVWASERKDVLSTFFWMLTLGAYIRYARLKPATRARVQPSARGSTAWYALALLLFALGLMSKAMLVTLPLILLLLDFWPLQRVRFSDKTLETRTFKEKFSAIWPLVREKTPFLVLTFAAGVVTMFAQHDMGALQTATRFPILHRLENAVLWYAGYLLQTVWPAKLAVFYSYPRTFSIGLVAAALVVELAISLVVLRSALRRPYLAVGWLWYVITLLPVIGLVQVGSQSHADRYTYIPLIGIFLMLAWGVNDLAAGINASTERQNSAKPPSFHDSPGKNRQRFVLLIFAAVALPLCILLSRRQVGYWFNSETLFRHALAVTKDNEIAHNNLGTFLFRRGKVDEAIGHFQAATHLAPAYALAEGNLGSALILKGRLDEAIYHLQRAVKLKPDYAGAYRNLGVAFGSKGRVDDALVCLGQAIKLAPNDAEAYFNLGVALASKGRLDDAILAYQSALTLQPGYKDARTNLQAALAAKVAAPKHH